MDKNIRSSEARLYVSEDVISKVIAEAAESVDGVVSIAGAPASLFRLLFAKSNYGKIRIRFEGGVLSVAVGIVAASDAAAIETAERVQESIKESVQNILGITVARVDVTVCDISAA